MLTGKLCEGKTLILKFAQSKLNLELIGKYVNCHGNEHAKFLCLLVHISRMVIHQKCTSQYCPNNNEEVIRHISTFSFSPVTNCSSFLQQLDAMFPTSGTAHGYCGAQFHADPPKESLHALNDRLYVDGSREMFYECRGAPTILQTSFMNTNPWVIPINISSIPGHATQSLPRNINVYGFNYKLAGYSLHASGHYTAIILWHGNECYYDGLLATKEQIFLPCKPTHLSNKMGSFAYYFIS